MERFVGVDVGAPRKGFDVAVIDGRRIVALESGQDLGGVAQVVGDVRPAVVGIDSPARCAKAGARSRPGERELARGICPIFYTPDEATVRSGNAFYGWVVHGLELYARLEESFPATTCVEVFPSAAWTVLAGPRNGRPKTRWSREALHAAGIEGVPGRSSQDARDAAGAALVAQLFARGLTDDYGGIAVPREGAVAFAG